MVIKFLFAIHNKNKSTAGECNKNEIGCNNEIQFVQTNLDRRKWVVDGHKTLES